MVFTQNLIIGHLDLVHAYKLHLEMNQFSTRMTVTLSFAGFPCDQDYFIILIYVSKCYLQLRRSPAIILNECHWGWY